MLQQRGDDGINESKPPTTHTHTHEWLSLFLCQNQMTVAEHAGSNDAAPSSGERDKQFEKFMLKVA